MDSLGLHEKLVLFNHDRFLDFVITVNSDMLTFAGTEGQFEGADEAAKYYQRNLRMFSNLHRVKLSADDRVFILMGASHTAFFRDFISRSPKYKMVNNQELIVDEKSDFYKDRETDEIPTFCFIDKALRDLE